jgi:glyoxylase-like metal-dependent hydrolase (beta-lactamase superfamily II)
MKRSIVLAGILTTGIAAIAATGSWARQQPNVATIEKVRDNLFVIKGGGGNTAAFITEKGVVVVDTKLDGWGQAILEKIRTVTDRPVTMILNTHTHGDHVGSNDEFPGTFEVVAHENTKVNMEKMPAFQPADKKRYLPGRTFKDKMSVLGGNDRIDLYYFGPGHTNGDAIIVWPALRVAHTGDLFSAKGTPLIDNNNGGTGVEYPRTIAKAAAGIAGVETVIPGHADVTDWKAFQDFAGFTQDFLTAVQQAIKQGKTAEAAAADFTMPAKWKDWGMARAKDNVAKIYAELKK